MVTREWCFGELRKKIGQLDWNATVSEVLPFVREHERASIELWGTNFFDQLIEKCINVPELSL